MPILTHRSALIYGALFLGLLNLVTWSFAAGLGGGLIFDDLPNLLPWQNMGDIHTLSQALTFTFSGNSLPGRPLSLLSFLIDDQSWPPNIYSLKRTNLAIHLLNTCLIFWLSLKLLPRLLNNSTAITGFALFIAAIWALHPLQVSNVSYIIQRMNLLSTLFELIGLLLFFYGRQQLSQAPQKALLICSIAIGFFMPVAILAKENGLLLCAFALLIEAFCFPKNTQAVWRAWKAVFLWFPLIAFLIYCVITLPSLTFTYPNRNFNSWERLLTQGPVLTDYLYKLLLPRLQGSGLYFDNFPVSRSLITPLNTLYCWLLLLGLLAAAWGLRHKLPLFAFGIFFYFTGHLMESTLIPLELYFEHRNYFPQWGLWLALLGLTPLLPKNISRSFKGLGVILAVIVVALLAIMARNNAALWSNTNTQTAIWYQDNPGSLRNILSYTNLLLSRMQPERAQPILTKAAQENSNSLILAISQRYIQCYWQGKPTDFTPLSSLASHAEHDNASLDMLKKMQEISQTGFPPAPSDNQCIYANQKQISVIYHTLLSNPHFNFPNVHEHIHEQLAEIAVKQRNLDEAMAQYQLAFEQKRNPIYPYRQALLLQSAGLSVEALPFLAQSEQALTLRYQTLYPDLKSRYQPLRQALQAATP